MSMPPGMPVLSMSPIAAFIIRRDDSSSCLICSGAFTHSREQHRPGWVKDVPTPVDFQSQPDPVNDFLQVGQIIMLGR